jgi:uncharacterized membrane protein
MTKFEKFMNIILKVIGVIYLIEFILYLLNIYEPYKFGIAGNMLVIGLFCLIAKYTKKY